MFKKITALILMFVLVVGVVPSAKAAPETIVDTGDVTIEGTNGFGDLLAQEITENQQESETESKDDLGGYSITDLEIVNNAATVTYDSLEEAILVVALHTEDGMQLITSAAVTVTPDAAEAVVTFEAEMPEYFLASAYLLDQYDYSPLCASYDTPMYTREMQELLASTVDDYDPEKVLNLDDDETTNFAVYADSTIVIEPVEGKNIVASIDNENAAYVIKNADEQMLSLKNGDVFAYTYGENELLIVKIGSIEFNGTTVTIIGAELEMSEAFEAVKIDGIGETEDIVVDDSAAGEGISYVGLVEDDGVNNPNSVEGGDTTTLKHKFEIKIKSKADDGHTSASLAVSGSLDLALDVSVKYYISTSHKYVEFKLSPHLTFSLGVQESLTLSEELGYLAVSPVPGVYVGFEPELQLKLDCKTEFKATLKSVIGFQYDTASGVQNISKKPELDVGIDVEGTIFLGVDFCPQVAIVSDKLSEIEVNMLVGFELEAKASGKAFEAYKKDADEYHECQECIAMDVRVKAKIGGTLKFLDQDWLSVSITIGEWKHKLGEMYYSLDKDEFGIGKCPNRLFRVTVLVKDKEYHPIPGETVTVSSLEEALTTDENGLVVFYTPEDEIVVRAEKDGYFSAERAKINKARKIVLCLIYQLDSGDNGGSAGGSEPGNPFEGIDFGGGEEDDYVDHGSDVASNACGENLTWKLYSNGLLSISGTGAMTDYSWARSVPWYSERSQINSVRIENGVTSIGDFAFYGCSGLTSMTIPDSVTSIGRYAFYDCYKLTSVTIGNSVASIGDYAFTFCNSLSSVEIPGSVTSIGNSAFSNCISLTTVTIPESITTIGSQAFSSCTNLTEILVDTGNPFYSNDEYGVLFDKNKTELIQAPCGISGDYIVPTSVTSIGRYAFYGCYSLTGVTTPDSLTSIGYYAFGYCRSLISVNIPNSVTSIGNSAFDSCWSLSNIIIPPNITSIGSSTFRNCTSLTSVIIPENVTSIGAWAFEECSSLTSVTICNGVETIGNYAFEDCYNLTSICIPDSITSIGQSAFDYCTKLTNVIIPYGVTYIKEYTFNDCYGLTNISIPDSVLSIGSYAFKNCRSLPSVTISSSIKSIFDSAFADCDSLNSVTFKGDAPFIYENAFSGVIATAYYPSDNATWTADVMQDYSGTITWAPYTSGEEFPGQVVSAESMALMGSAPQVSVNAVYPGDYGTEITDEYTLKTASFFDLVPNQQYVMLAMVSIEAENLLAPENLLAIDQGMALEDGTLRFTYVQREPHDASYVFVCGASNKDLGDAEIAFPEMVDGGELQVVNPRVVYDGETLTEGQDYIITGTVDYTEPGVYTCWIRGIRNYAGQVECTYTVAEHEHSFTNYISDGNATCSEDGTKTAKCDRCDVTDTIPDAGSALGHDMGVWETVRSVTCTENGEEQRNCSRCNHSESREIAAVGHRWDQGAVTAPTCTERGYTTYTCRCGESHTADYVDALGHALGEWVVIQEPTTAEDGVKERGCSRCTYTEQRSIPKKKNPFNDVDPGSFYYDPVMWAVGKGITNGTSDTTFSPNAQCMRAQVVTFLWRAAGSPEPTKKDNPFVDVKPIDFYYKAVLWALENNITSGMDATHFGPTLYCNRAQVVTFLYRSMGSPELESMDNPFADVQAGAFYEKPVLWAVENGITNGLSATAFGPNSICNRAQIVTFLYRAFVD